MDTRKIFIDSFIFTTSYLVISFMYLIGNFVDVESKNNFRIVFDNVVATPTEIIFENYLDPFHSLSIMNLILVFTVVWIFFIGLIIFYSIIRLAISNKNRNFY